MVGSGALGLGWGRWLWPWAGPGVRAPAGLTLPPYSTCFSIKNQEKKDKEKKEKVGAESGHEDNFPGLLKICMVREN